LINNLTAFKDLSDSWLNTKSEILVKPTYYIIIFELQESQ
jgi:hypothetical protein